MCGILACLLGEPGTVTPSPSPEAFTLLTRRGPDCQGSALGLVQGLLNLHSFVLHMQGETSQPFVSDQGVLCFNGELYCDDDVVVERPYSDTKVVSDILSDPRKSWETKIASLDEYEGEWSFLFFDKSSSTIVYCRDWLGRRSLLEGLDANGNVNFISSVAFESAGITWKEIACDHWFRVDMLSNRSRTQSRRTRNWHGSRDITSRSSITSREEILLKLLSRAVARRIDYRTLGSSRQFGVLFSGGLDSVLIAALASRACPISYTEPITLVNVSFNGEASPDRIAARSALKELQALYPERLWNFVAYDVQVTEVRSKSDMILKHMAPKKSVMDFNLANVFFFASGHAPPECRALLCGIGADELFGGYSRHKQTCNLAEELMHDLERLWDRNLGRDDRCVSAHGKELRIPFLDTAVVDFVLGDLGASEKDKKILRDVAYMIGLTESATRTKRAAQFGSRMSKLVKSGRNGTQDFHIDLLATSISTQEDCDDTAS